jgi:MtaA/CmuA family methyltransferase
MKTYTGKERIEAAFRREYTDRVPYYLDFGPQYSKEIGMTTDEYFANIDNAYKIMGAQLIALPSDMVVVPQNLLSWWSPPNMLKYKIRSEEVAFGGLKDKAALSDLEYIDPKQSPGLNKVRESCQRATNTFRDKATRPLCFGPFTIAALLRGVEQLIFDISDDPDFVHRLMRLTTEAVKAMALFIAQTGVTVVVVGDSQASLSVISPKIYREFVMPYHKEIFSYLRENAPKGVHGGLHICGYLDQIMEELVSLGIDYIEIDAPSSLKRIIEVSNKELVVRGNIGAEIFLQGTKEQIENAVKDCIDIAAKGSAYILSTGCQIPLNAPIQSVRYFLDAAEKYGVYQPD